jgi:hypothetical protein
VQRLAVGRPEDEVVGASRVGLQVCGELVDDD